VPTDKELYSQELNDIVRRYGRLEDGTIRQILALLEDTRKQVNALLANAENFEGYRLQQLQAQIENLIAQFEARANSVVRNAVSGSYDTGAQAAVGPLQALKMPKAFITPAPQLLNTLLTYDATLVTGITNEIRQAVDVQVRNVALGLQNSTTAMTNLTDLFGRMGVQQGKMVTSGISAKAERVLRTELQTAFNVSNYAQQQANAERMPGLLKRWIATADARTRPGHLRIHNETRATPIPVGEMYTVYNITPSGIVKGKTEMRYPLDPLAPGWARINCRCTQATIHPEIGVIGSSLDGRIAAEMKRRNIEGRILTILRGNRAPEYVWR
jgi:hypothetical protein